MHLHCFTDEFIDDYDGLEYNVITRPQELIDHQKKTSTSKVLLEPSIDKSGMTFQYLLYYCSYYI